MHIEALVGEYTFRIVEDFFKNSPLYHNDIYLFSLILSFKA